jgi:hypothetical protein
MKNLGLSRYSLAIGAVAALLAGCGTPPLNLSKGQDDTQPQIGARGDSLRLPLPSPDDTSKSPLALKTCATTPPQYEWIFTGACRKFHLTAKGGHFSLGAYQGITVKGLLGKNTAKGR